MLLKCAVFAIKIIVLSKRVHTSLWLRPSILFIISYLITGRNRRIARRANRRYCIYSGPVFGFWPHGGERCTEQGEIFGVEERTVDKW